jgi:excisionase family DNA binding protein
MTCGSFVHNEDLQLPKYGVLRQFVRGTCFAPDLLCQRRPSESDTSSRLACMTENTLEPLLTASQLANVLSVGTATVLDWHQQKKIPSYRLAGRAVRFRVSEVEAWLQEQRR